jgi:hypothetical protein
MGPLDLDKGANWIVDKKHLIINFDRLYLGHYKDHNMGCKNEKDKYRK